MLRAVTEKPYWIANMAKYAWSYSSLDLYKQCPHKYYRLRVVKDIVEPTAEHLSYGVAVHKAAEDFIRDGVPVPEQYSFIQPVLDSLVNLRGEKLCEYQMGLTKDLEPCAFDDKANIWWRGIADLIVLQDNRAFLFDYKTSKSAKYADTKQLEILSLALFKHFPHIAKVKAGLLFVVSQEVVRGEFDLEDEQSYWVKWVADTNRLEKAFDTNTWNPRPNFTCKNYCPVTDCLHNGNN